MSTVLEIKNLSKKYKDVQALDKLNLSVQEGMVFGILGPNGSGKTTTLGILLGVLNPSEGEFSWFQNGKLDENRIRIGALLETPNFFPYLSAVQNLRLVAKIKDLDDVEERIEKVLGVVKLLPRKNSKFKTFSLGMKQRLAIASALLNDPEILVLDEPTNGLDPQGIAEIRSLIIEIGKKGKTIIIASHQLDEIEKVCTDVVILKQGVVIKQDKIDKLVETSKRVIIKADDLVKAKEIAEKMPDVSLLGSAENELLMEVEEHVTTTAINKYFFDNGLVLSELKESKKSLEDQFLEIIKE